MEGRENIKFALPQEQDEAGFYIIFERESYVERLEEAGFEREALGMFTILYKS